MQQVYKSLIEKVRQIPELTVPIEDENILEKHQLLIEEMMTTLFPATISDDRDLYAVSVPFQFKTIYSSRLFKETFLGESGATIIMPDSGTEFNLNKEKMQSAYQMVLAKLYGVPNEGFVRTVHPYKCPSTDLDLYMELELDVRFIDVTVNGDLPALPEDCEWGDCSMNDIVDRDDVKQAIPLDLFTFDGFVIVRVREVTEREVINKIKNRLLSLHAFDDAAVFHDLQGQIQNLVGVPGIQIAIKPFFQVNDHLVISAPYSSDPENIKKAPDPSKHQEVYNELSAVFGKTKRPLLIPDLTDDVVLQYPFLGNFQTKGWRNVIAFPLLNADSHLVGILGIISPKPDVLSYEHVAKVEPAIPLFVLAIEKSQELLDTQVDKVIKDKFTAVQPAVEWRFTEAALKFLTQKKEGRETTIEPIVFNNVYPLYGAIDIRNSSVERNHAIQQDLLQQLHMADEIVRQAQKQTKFPLLEEIRYKLDKYSDSVAAVLFSDDEINIQNFLKKDIVQLFRHLQTILPQLNQSINDYFAAVNSPVEMLYQHRQAYEKSITQINQEVARFIDNEQESAQHIFPHYFERFVTDGVDFNIYIGQSISPNKTFDMFYLKNLKIWQLTTLAKAAQLTNSLEKKLSMSLQTTQLILAHSHPISISFRTAERKFDVDGAYNIRYEIIKKRIDKVHIKNSNERLTQPGMLAIVYSQPQEGHEYVEYIDFLRNQQLLKGPVQQFELEELQGVSGLKGLRVAINLEPVIETATSIGMVSEGSVVKS
ncbi:MAG: hypothetical protein H7Y31_15550 [Chitinophagaceae bacterium]|nr:hypothetical protein [Chitinophagaceae bacterium]